MKQTNKKGRGLGKGLESLLQASGNGATTISVNGDKEVVNIGLELISPSAYQPRREIGQESLRELAESISRHGVMQPIILRPHPRGQDYELVAGERRWRASQLAGKTEVPALVRDISDQSASAMALIENLQREDLNPLEEALALQRLQQEHNLTQQELAELIGKSRSAIANSMRLLALDAQVQKMLGAGELDMGHARALLPLEDDQQRELARMVSKKQLTVRQVEQLVKKMQADAGIKQLTLGGKDPNLERIESELATRFGMEVNIHSGRGGAGKLTFRFASHEQLANLANKIGIDL